ncbi:MAG TPA: hypothetical protein VNM38_07195 [Solirubrobacterales bacterium]|nr:hypothetical protein [Solirubrobacterales bacterium]
MSVSKVKLGIIGVCVIAIALAVAAISSDSGDSSQSKDTAQHPQAGIDETALSFASAGSKTPDQEGEEQVEGSSHPPRIITNHERVVKHEALPCTGTKDPVNFEVFSLGPAFAGLAFAGTSRRCDPGTPSWGWPNNYVDYLYGKCAIPEGATGCAPPLQVQSWPACQRSMDEYSFGGSPLPHRKLSPLGEAEVVEFTMPSNRIEVYTGATTIVLYGDMRIARKALPSLRPQKPGAPPAKHANELRGKSVDGLPAPNKGSTEGDLPCQS